MDAESRYALKKAEKLAREDDHAAAIEMLDAIAGLFPAEAEVWAMRGYVNGRSGNLSQAIADMSKCISLRGDHVDDYFTRGRFSFRAGSYLEAINDFTEVIKREKDRGSTYYLDAAYVFRADAYVHIGRFSEAKADCMCVADKGDVWTNGLTSVSEILAVCDKGSCGG